MTKRRWTKEEKETQEYKDYVRELTRKRQQAFRERKKNDEEYLEWKREQNRLASEKYRSNPDNKDIINKRAREYKKAIKPQVEENKKRIEEMKILVKQADINLEDLKDAAAVDQIIEKVKEII